MILLLTVLTSLPSHIQHRTQKTKINSSSIFYSIRLTRLIRIPHIHDQSRIPRAHISPLRLDFTRFTCFKCIHRDHPPTNIHPNHQTSDLHLFLTSPTYKLHQSLISNHRLSSPLPQQQRKHQPHQTSNFNNQQHVGLQHRLQGQCRGHDRREKLKVIMSAREKAAKNATQDKAVKVGSEEPDTEQEVAAGPRMVSQNNVATSWVVSKLTNLRSRSAEPA
jgi:hypothetical protein